jgi:hypothetical protein
MILNGANHHTKNVSYVTWVIHSPTSKLVSSGGVFIDPMTNNVTKYSVVI